MDKPTINYHSYVLAEQNTANTAVKHDSNVAKTAYICGMALGFFLFFLVFCFCFCFHRTSRASPPAYWAARGLNDPSRLPPVNALDYIADRVQHSPRTSPTFVGTGVYSRTRAFRDGDVNK